MNKSKSQKRLFKWLVNSFMTSKFLKNTQKVKEKQDPEKWLIGRHGIQGRRQQGMSALRLKDFVMVNKATPCLPGIFGTNL